MIHHHQWILSVRTHKVPVQGSKLDSFPPNSGIAPSSEHWTSPLSELTDHVNSPYYPKTSPTSISNSSEFLVVLLIGVLFCSIVGHVQCQTNHLLWDSKFHPFGHLFGDVILHLFHNIGPKLSNEGFQLLPEKFAVSESHLVHIAIHMDQLHISSSFPYLVHGPVFSLIDKLGSPFQIGYGFRWAWPGWPWHSAVHTPATSKATSTTILIMSYKTIRQYWLHEMWNQKHYRVP